MVKHFTGWHAPTSSSIDLRPSTRWSQVTMTVGPTTFHASRALSQNSILDMHDKFQRITKIEFHTVTPSRVTYENTKHSTSSFFRKGNFALLGRDRVFEDRSGREYRRSLLTA
ncbi:hypothetical protein FA13DRAFT_1736137 [Coprinellus micaceus]|uniref:Uncharacterized protein n=1 Tax=Coprinellus micaceus TaxID=71717 RepID=A0A4Y7T1X7_COPMI|nr:hypothetical protein FA13DRAFT_1736137 [Coprinellus micaceus]